MKKSGKTGERRQNMKDFQTELENLPRLKGGVKTYAARTESLGVRNVVTTIERNVVLLDSGE